MTNLDEEERGKEPQSTADNNGQGGKIGRESETPSGHHEGQIEAAQAATGVNVSLYIVGCLFSYLAPLLRNTCAPTGV